MSSIQRITGTNSGLDVDALVKASMTTYQNRIDKETQNEKVLEYQQEQYKQIMSDASDFYDKYFDVLKTGNLFSSSTYQSVSFESGDDTKVTAKGFAGADVSDYKVTTTQLASKATASFKESDLTGTDKTKIYVKVGTKEVSVDIVKADGEIDMSATAKNLNSALNTAGVNVSAKYSEFSSSIVLESGTMGESASFSAVASNTNSDLSNASNVYTGKNAKGIITKGTETYAVDQASNVLTVDNVQFTFKSPSAWATATDLTALKSTDSEVTVSEDGKTITSKDGKTTTVTSSDGTVTTTKVDTTTGAITQTVTKDSTTETKTYSSVSLTGSTNVEDLKDKIVSFVNDYNTLLQSINTKIYETRDTDYMPLTDAQKEEMTDDQIEKWETKAKTGLLRKDTDLERITAAMKSAMSTVISGSGLNLESIGIEPVENYAEKNGMYTIDEEKLTQALEENAANVKDLFTRTASTTNTNDKGGIFTQLAATLKSEFKSSTASLAKKAGLDGTSTQYSNTLTKSIAEKKTLIDELNDKFSDKEDALYNKYSALETALEKLNAQQSSLASMLGTS
ncbi:flagellar filament capping protein FliD [Clostridium butyricum]|uniref:flagellar filament capping protein FliD n=1 Tax=Clostridium butyricum TaxID=1492 RepID=UPI00374F4815